MQNSILYFHQNIIYVLIIEFAWSTCNLSLRILAKGMKRLRRQWKGMGIDSGK